MPFLEVIAGPLDASLEGRRFELARPRLIFEVGSRASLPVVLPGRATTSRHGRIDRAGGEWFFTSYVSPGSWLDGEMLKANEATKLTHGAVLELGRCGYVLSFCEREPAGRSEELEQAIARSPDDAQPWLVYGDWLQERGDPWGAELVRGPDAEPPALERLFRRHLGRTRSLGPLMRAVREHDVAVRWSVFNAVSHVGLRPDVSGARDLANAAWLLAHVGHAPAARLATSLDLGVCTGQSDVTEQRMARLLGAVADGAPLPALRTLTMGYTTRPNHLALPAEVLGRLAAKSPHASLSRKGLFPSSSSGEALRLLGTPPQWLIGGLKVGEAGRLDRLQTATVGADSAATFRIIGLLGKKTPRGGARLAWDGACWRVYREAAPSAQRVESTFLRLNHHTVQFDEVLMPGDELELGPGIRFRFELS